VTITTSSTSQNNNEETELIIGDFFTSVYDHMSTMGGQDWAHFSAGFAIGSVVEVAATVETPNACLTQASTAGKSAFLAYYYYSEYLNPHNGGDSDKTNLVYSTFYLVEFVDALNKGGCYEFNLSVEDVQEYLGFNTAG